MLRPRDAEQHPMENLPVDTLVYLLAHFVQFAWSKFGNHPKGWPLVQAICDYVHEHLQFGYEHANPMKTAWQAHNERRGVCRDFAHLAITLCRCMKRDTAQATWEILACPRHLSRWILVHGLRCSSESVGTPLMPVTTCPALVAF